MSCNVCKELCEFNRVTLAHGNYVSLTIEKCYDGCLLNAYGDDECSIEINYCPVCRRELNAKT